MTHKVKLCKCPLTATITCSSNRIPESKGNPTLKGLVQCQPPPDIQNGTRSNQETAVFPSGMLVKYTCNPGYALIGEATIQCIDNGMWSFPAPNCEVRQCPPPPDIQNGNHSNQETRVFPSGMLVKYACDSGYALIGEATLHCTNAGRWSSPAPNCEGTFCDQNFFFFL
uniref:Sushi domain-containing protein n=1 Tax=Laticauda laticaudata TaxID=8630 RepID=A0A8C5SRY0_LATLA